MVPIGAKCARGAVSGCESECNGRDAGAGSWPAGRNSGERTAIDDNYSIPDNTRL